MNKSLDCAHCRFGFLLILLALLFLLDRFLLCPIVVLGKVLLQVDFAVLAQNALHLHLTFALVQSDVLLVLVDLLDGTF